jgi:RNA polymerase sigma factor (sigma-70 family)
MDQYHQMPAASDERLIEIERLYARQLSAFIRVARAILGDRDRAIEAVQDGFAAAIRTRTSYRGEGPFDGCVWRVVVNAARKAARHRIADVGAIDVEPAHELPPARPDVAPLIAALPERQRLVVFLRYYADLDYRSIGEALGIEVGTVAATLAAAHATVRRQLEQEVKSGVWR